MRQLLAIVVLVFAASGCKDDPPPPPVIQEKAPEPEVEAPEPHPLMQERQAFGLPFPPEVAYVRKGLNFVEVGSKLRMPQLQEFFAGKLVDYEMVEIGRNEVRYLSLHSSAPDIRMLKRAPRIPIAVRYTLRTSDVEQQAREAKREPLKPGDKVETKLSNGELLAPGAIYGQPYTPQPGDPLYQDRYRANFGKPFGTWVLN